MIVELGHYALILALLVALLQGILPLVGAATRNWHWQSLARPAAIMQFLLVSLAFAALAYAFQENDFSVRYVADHSNTRLPLMYRFAAVWGGHEGSLLLWLELLAIWTVAVAIFSRQMPLAMVARVIAVLGLTSTGFLLFVLTTSNPFERLFPVPMEGKDLNPLLQDPGLVIHPPMLYMGYVGFSVAFAFAIAALLAGRLDVAWARWSRPWTLVAWVFLSFGIGLGSWWAYNELGWGGWWFWDPVENASLMPWLCGTALIHSLMVTEKRGSFKAWTVLLAISAFSLSLLGTFLVRSGVLNSVHAFASDPTRGVFILVFLALVVGSSLTLFAWRAGAVSLGAKMAWVSRESVLLSNSVLLVVATAAVLLGTLYPMVIDALNMGKLSVGPPYFNTVFVPLMVPVLFLMVLGVRARWRESTLQEWLQPLRRIAVAALLGGGMVALYFGWSWGVAGGMALGIWVILGTLEPAVERLRKPGKIPLSFFAMHCAHLGMAVLVIGVTLVKGYEVEKDVRIAAGDTVTLGDYSFELQRVTEVTGPNYVAKRAEVLVKRKGDTVTTLFPEKRRYPSTAMPMTEAAIDTNLWRDLYVSLGEPLNNPEQEWSMRFYLKPFLSWIWLGVLMMVFGGLLAVSDKRYRRSAEARLAGAGATA
ncbi:MAG: heme lyase CcmF/NrfE family subunit [Betaproteobacteria bacterium]|nr:heme lyase CcmF/NrfE family subunit [Betaproteobacteria bacterium]